MKWNSLILIALPSTRVFFPFVQHGCVFFFFSLSLSFPLEEKSLLQLKALGYTSWVY